MLIIRELLWRNDRFNTIARGVPRMSPSLLSARLRELERVGLVEREKVAEESRYRLTAAGHELMPLIEQIGAWGQRWMQEILEDEYDGLDVCDTDPGQEVHMWLGTDPTLTKIWLAQLTWTQAARHEGVRLHGDATAVRTLSNWVGASRFAAVEQAAVPLERLTALS